MGFPLTQIKMNYYNGYLRLRTIHPKVFITHGEEEVSKAFAEVVELKLGFNTERPSCGDKYVLN